MPSTSSPFKWYSDEELEEEVELPTEDESREAAKPAGCRQSTGLCLVICLALVLALLTMTAAGCCPEGCVTTVTCQHSFFNKSHTKTVDGCWATCPIPYEKSEQARWCPVE